MNHNHSTHGRAAGLAALAALAAALAMPAQAQSVSREASAQPPAPRGLLTGKVSPQAVQRKDGSIELESDESMLHYSVAVRQANGKMAYYCVHSAEDARRLAAGELKPTKAMEHSHDR